MTRPNRRVVIVGGGVAGQRCATTLRRRGYDGSLTLVSEEPVLPYDRPLLSKEFLAGLIDGCDLELMPAQRYADDAIDIVLGQRAVQLRPSEHEVILDSGDTLPYDRLVVATGGSARRPEQLDRGGVHVLRSLADAQALRDALARCAHVAVIGGGVLGCEIAATASELGLGVSLLSSQDTLMGPALGRQVGERITAMHREHGIDVRTNVLASVAACEPGKPAIVQLDDGSTLSTDVAVVAVGMSPATGWLTPPPRTPSPAHVVSTDHIGRSAIPDVFAAGDCASWFDERHDRHLRAEHWEVAAEHGSAVAGFLLGDDSRFDPVPYFWSNQYASRLQWIGPATGWDSVEIDNVGDGFVARYRQDGRLMAVLAMNNPAKIVSVREQLAQSGKKEFA